MMKKNTFGRTFDKQTSRWSERHKLNHPRAIFVIYSPTMKSLDESAIETHKNMEWKNVHDACLSGLNCALLALVRSLEAFSCVGEF